MVTDVAVVVPWASTDPDRVAAWACLRRRWPWPVVEGEPSSGVWCKAAAVAQALDRTDAEILVIADADVWCDATDEAAAKVAAGTPWAVPHGGVHRLCPSATADVLVGGELTITAETMQAPYLGHAGGGIVVIRRDVYEECPLDPRFVGWGQEDDSWALALTCLHGRPWRGPAPLFHLFHAPQPRRTRIVGSDESLALFRRYRAARHRPDAMRALLAEIPTRQLAA